MVITVAGQVEKSDRFWENHIGTVIESRKETENNASVQEIVQLPEKPCVGHLVVSREDHAKVQMKEDVVEGLHRTALSEDDGQPKKGKYRKRNLLNPEMRRITRSVSASHIDSSN